MLLLLDAASAVDDVEVARRVLKFGLWQRGDVFPCGSSGCSDGSSMEGDEDQRLAARWALMRQTPVLTWRGGADGCDAASGSCEPPTSDLDQLRAELGPEFSAALDANLDAHEADCRASCEFFYCGDADAASTSASGPPTPVQSHPMGDVPPEDFASAFNFPLDLIKVTAAPLIPPEEAEEVVAIANAEGVAGNEYTSGKYRLGGDWVKKMPRTLAWFNRRLETTIFPTIASLFPEVVRGPQVLQAHSVATLKY